MLEKDLEIIKKIVEKHHLTAFEIAKNVSISINTIANVLKDTPHNPKQKTVSIILDYLLENYNEVNELKENRIIRSITHNNPNFCELKIDDKLNIIFEILGKLENKIQDTSKLKETVKQNKKTISQTNRTLLEYSLNNQAIIKKLSLKIESKRLS